MESNQMNYASLLFDTFGTFLYTQEKIQSTMLPTEMYQV